MVPVLLTLAESRSISLARDAWPAAAKGVSVEAQAIGALRHDILVAYYHIVRDRVPFRELGPDWQRKRYSPEHRARRLQRQLEALGYTVMLQATEEAPSAA